jgi:hypothetical protein
VLPNFDSAGPEFFFLPVQGSLPVSIAVTRFLFAATLVLTLSHEQARQSVFGPRCVL